MSPRQKRMALVLGIVAGVSVAGGLALKAFRQNVTFFFDPTQVAAGEVHAGDRFRLGGMVTKGSVQRAPGSLEVHFVVTDFKHDVPVSYTGVLPDLFREGQGVVAHGRMAGDTFIADEVLAKHDEKYMPPEVARSLKKRQEERAAAGAQTTSAAGQPPPGAAGAPVPLAPGQPPEAGAHTPGAVGQTSAGAGSMAETAAAPDGLPAGAPQTPATHAGVPAVAQTSTH